MNLLPALYWLVVETTSLPLPPQTRTTQIPPSTSATPLNSDYLEILLRCRQDQHQATKRHRSTPLHRTTQTNGGRPYIYMCRGAVGHRPRRNLSAVTSPLISVKKLPSRPTKRLRASRRRVEWKDFEAPEPARDGLEKDKGIEADSVELENDLEELNIETTETVQSSAESHAPLDAADTEDEAQLPRMFEPKLEATTTTLKIKLEALPRLSPSHPELTLPPGRTTSLIDSDVIYVAGGSGDRSLRRYYLSALGSPKAKALWVMEGFCNRATESVHQQRLCRRSSRSVISSLTEKISCCHFAFNLLLPDALHSMHRYSISNRFRWLWDLACPAKASIHENLQSYSSLADPCAACHSGSVCPSKLSPPRAESSSFVDCLLYLSPPREPSCHIKSEKGIRYTLENGSGQKDNKLGHDEDIKAIVAVNPSSLVRQVGFGPLGL
ncbi:hypothetical protein C8J56DRAFT_1040488 [Mycena floridula]|nr:hypothetical protein C8J56DRAFT_1040488 [Mycena floridula]